jgi:hypothetical protein
LSHRVDFLFQHGPFFVGDAKLLFHAFVHLLPHLLRVRPTATTGPTTAESTLRTRRPAAVTTWRRRVLRDRRSSNCHRDQPRCHVSLRHLHFPFVVR